MEAIKKPRHKIRDVQRNFLNNIFQTIFDFRQKVKQKSAFTKKECKQVTILFQLHRKICHAFFSKERNLNPKH